MSKSLKLFLLFACIYALFGRDGARGQSTKIAPDCIIPFSFTTTGRVPSVGFNNNPPTGQNGCTVWVVSYQNQGFTPISLRIDSAADTVSGGKHVASTWGAFSGTILDGNAAGATTGPGINPNTDTNWGFTMLKGSPAWVSVNLSTATGSGLVSGTLLGWRPHGVDQTSAPASPSTCPNGADGAVQVSESGACYGDAARFFFDKATGEVLVGNAVTLSPSGTAVRGRGDRNIFGTDYSLFDPTFQGWSWDDTSNIPLKANYLSPDGTSASVITFQSAIPGSALQLYSAFVNTVDQTGSVGSAFDAGGFALPAVGTTIGHTVGGHLYTEVFNTGGTVTNASALWINGQDSSVAPTTLVNERGIWITDLVGSSINTYAIQIDDQTVGANNWAIKTGTGKVEFGDVLIIDPVAFAALTALTTDGMQISCSDCAVTSALDNTCAGGGPGAQAFRINGAWKCVL